MSEQAVFTHAAAEALIEQLDPAVFILDSQTDHNDKKMLLALQACVRTKVETYTYVEIGSWMGGTLVPHLMDTKCGRIISIDKRPAAQADERGCTWYYVSTSTRMMLDRLESHLPATALAKLETYDCDAQDLPDQGRSAKFDLAFIDGEHTNRAAFQDFISLLPLAQQNCIIAFHDANFVTDAICNVETLLRHQNIVFESLYLPKVVFALFIGSYAGFAQSFRHVAFDRATFLSAAKQELWDEISKHRAAA